MKQTLLLAAILIIYTACSKSETKPTVTPPAPVQKRVLMRVQYSGGATAVIDGVYIPDPVTHTSTLIAGPYSSSAEDSVNSPNGYAPQVFVHGGNGTDHVQLIDQNNKKTDAVVSTANPTIISVQNFVSTDSFTVRVYR